MEEDKKPERPTSSHSSDKDAVSARSFIKSKEMDLADTI